MGSCLGKIRKEPKDKGATESSEYASVGSKRPQGSPVRYEQKSDEPKTVVTPTAPTPVAGSPVTTTAASTPKKVEEKKETATSFFESVLTEGDITSRMIQYQDSWEALATAVGLDVEDPALLAFSYEVCNSDPKADIQQLTLTESAWNLYSSNLNITSCADLKKQIPTWHSSLSDIKSKKFRQIYEFAFTFIRDQSVRNLPADDAAMYWQLLLNGKWSYLTEWVEFIETSGKKVISRDEWCVLLDLAKDANAVETYDTDSSWPLLIDDFITSLKKKS